LHKPNAVTALTRRGFYRISHKISHRDVSGFGGELGESLENLFGNLKLDKMRRLVIQRFTIVKRYLGDDELADKARRLVLGICHEPVENKLMNTGLNCGKRNLGKL
jgi:hypothetical protein